MNVMLEYVLYLAAILLSMLAGASIGGLLVEEHGWARAAMIGFLVALVIMLISFLFIGTLLLLVPHGGVS